LGTTLAYLAMAAALYFVAQRLYYIAYEWMRLVKLVLATATVFILGYWIWTAPWQKAVLLAAFPIALFLIGFFEKGELRRLSALFNKRSGKRQSYNEKQTPMIQEEI
jgi:hypothetical protein